MVFGIALSSSGQGYETLTLGTGVQITLGLLFSAAGRLLNILDIRYSIHRIK